MRRLYLVLGVLALLVVCCAPESTESTPSAPEPAPASATSSEDTCIADCKGSDHPGCERACNASASVECSYAPPRGSVRRGRGLPPSNGIGGTAGASGSDSSGVGGMGGSGGNTGTGGAVAVPKNDVDCLCEGEIPPQCVTVCAPPETDKGGGGLKCSFAPPR